ncbi:dimeric alpha-beta barrel [Lucifera butyrica]|uniref:Dimeric alpha-beta barrel n=1 Tax=Lucifera butyrica TaxID=1351585 RepID=A0A498R4Y3_9FIRM|nr:Lrp/AsnC family transcriptional regulator [Lucifera butyrica]VBB05877.1 dimeric alpha-beta barrel [Lucifera butyrica]
MEKDAEVKELLELLEKNHNHTVEEMAVMLGRSPAEVQAQIKQLEDEKIIVTYQPIINWEKAGVDSVTAIIEVKITPQREVGFDALAERIYRFPEVRSLYLMSGAFDLLVMLEGQTLREIADFVSTKLSTIEGVISTTTHFMLKQYKYAGVIIEDEEEDHRLVVTP